VRQNCGVRELAGFIVNFKESTLVLHLAIVHLRFRNRRFVSTVITPNRSSAALVS